MGRDNPFSGVLLIDKPSGMTSHDVVDRVRKVSGMRRVGHTGTLDPMATGLMVVCLGPATRISQFLTGLSKDYNGSIRLGAMSSTYDAEGEIVEQENVDLPRDGAAITAAMNRQLGSRTQLPPPYSAIKVKGRKLYDYARKGEPVPQKPRQVWIDHFNLTDYTEPIARFEASVGSGTYIRSMVHDLGLDLETGAYLDSLRRTRVGHFEIRHAVPLRALIEQPLLVGERLMGLSEALGHLPKITVSDATAGRILNGQGFSTRDILECEGLPQRSEDTVVLNPRGEVLSVVRGEPVRQTETDTPETVAAGSAQDDPFDELFFRSVRVLGQDR